LSEEDVLSSTDQFLDYFRNDDGEHLSFLLEDLLIEMTGSDINKLNETTISE